LRSLQRKSRNQPQPVGLHGRLRAAVNENIPSHPLPTVLIVEDHDLLRLHAVTVIEDAGFPTVEASDANEAITILRVRQDIRVVFTDIEMPGSMDGLRLARAIRERWPPIELIITSDRYDVGLDQLPHRGKFLSKPYQADVLVATVRELAT
jgi:CheY-like chemotaxis protein